MANYLELKQQFDSNKTFIKQVLNDQKCQRRLKSEGLLTLKKLLKQTIKKINNLPKVDNCEYSYIFLDDKRLNNALLKFKKWGLIRVIDRKGGYTDTLYRYINLNLDKFNDFYINTQKYYRRSLSLS